MISLFIAGIPQPGGSKRAFVVKGRAVVTDDCKRNKDWRSLVSHTAKLEYAGLPLAVPLAVTMRFTMPRPKSHYRTGKHAGELRPDAPTYHAKKPDALKLARSTEDALTGIIWRDDCQTVALQVSKVYGDRPGCHVEVHVAEEPS